MNRRGFLKSLVIAAIVPALPGMFIPTTGPVKSKGITNAQLLELIKLTLRDLPTKSFEVGWSNVDYSILRIYGVK